MAIRFPLGAIGAWVGWIGLPSVLVWASAAGLSLVAARRLTGRAVSGSDRLAFGVFLSIGAWFTWLYGPIGFRSRVSRSRQTELPDQGACRRMHDPPSRSDARNAKPRSLSASGVSLVVLGPRRSAFAARAPDMQARRTGPGGL